MDESTIRTMYDRFSSIPGAWEVDAWTCRATSRSPYRSRVMRQLGLGATSAVLDVACGTGLNFDYLQRAVRGTGRIVGLDNSAKTLELARRRIGRRGWSNVELVEVSSADYRPEERFDAAVCTFAIDIIPRWQETIDMMVDAVRPGGRLGIIGFRESARLPYSALNPLWRAIAAPLGGAELNRKVRERIGHSCDEAFYEEVYGGFYYLLIAATREVRQQGG